MRTPKTFDTGKFQSYFRLYAADYRKGNPRTTAFEKLLEEHRMTFRRKFARMLPSSANDEIARLTAQLEDKLKPKKRSRPRGSMPPLVADTEPKELTPLQQPTTPAVPPPKQPPWRRIKVAPTTSRRRHSREISSADSNIGHNSPYMFNRHTARVTSPAVSETLSTIQGKIERDEYRYEGTPGAGSPKPVLRRREAYKDRIPEGDMTIQTELAYAMAGGVPTGREYDTDVTVQGVSRGALRQFQSTHPNIEDSSIVLNPSERMLLQPDAARVKEKPMTGSLPSSLSDLLSGPQTPTGRARARARAKLTPGPTVRAHQRALDKIKDIRHIQETKIIPTFGGETTPVPRSPRETARTFAQVKETFSDD